MFFASANRSEIAFPSSGMSFARDLGASMLALGALGALLVAVPNGRGDDARLGRMAAQPAQASQRHADMQATGALPRQPSDEAAIPDEDEERIAKAVMAFALSKVSPLRPEPIASVPATAASQPSAPAAALPPRKPAKLQAPPRPNEFRLRFGGGQAGFVQAEWPVRSSVQSFAMTPKDRPKDQPMLVALTRHVPGRDRLVGGAQSLAGDARKTVAHGVGGLRSGMSAIQEKALAIAGRLW